VAHEGFELADEQLSIELAGTSYQKAPVALAAEMALTC
jgi:hypothetical protein